MAWSVEHGAKLEQGAWSMDAGTWTMGAQERWTQGESSWTMYGGAPTCLPSTAAISNQT